MEESIKAAFGLKEKDLRELPVLTLAYIGDAVYELILRTAFGAEGKSRGQQLNRTVQRYVSAVGQSKIAEGLQELLTEEELSVYRRGRNSHPESVAKHATIQEYHRATGLEALMGYLYLKGETDRAAELVKRGLPYADGTK